MSLLSKLLPIHAAFAEEASSALAGAVVLSCADSNSQPSTPDSQPFHIPISFMQPEPPLPQLSTPKLSTVLQLIATERARQDRLFADQDLPFTCASPGIFLGTKMLVLAEEFGEVARACQDLYHGECEAKHKASRDHLREELVQLAAVAAAWAESLI